MEYKTCKKCKIEKELNEENFIYRKNGDYWEGKCRECNNLDRRRKQENKLKNEVASEYEIKNIAPKIENKAENKKKEYKKMNIFNDNEIAILKQIIKEYNSVNTDITIEKGQRIRKTYNIDEVLSKKILQEARKQGITASDILNIAVKKYFFNV